MATTLWLIAAITVATAFCAMMRCVPVPLGLAIFGLLPIVLGFVWANSGHSFSWFQWAKVYSVAVAAGGLVAMRSERVEKWGWGGAVLVGIFVINIAEAMVAEGLKDPGPNVAAGLLLLLTMPGASAVSMNNDLGHRELRYALTVPWVIGYTLWNFSFVYGANIVPHGHAASAAFAAAHLAAPILATGGDVSRWAEARAFTLAAFMFWRFTFPSPPLMHHSPHWYNSNADIALGVASLLFALGLLSVAVRNRSGADVRR